MMLSIHIKTSLIVIRYSMSVALFRKCINVYYCIIIPLLGFCVTGEGWFFLVKSAMTKSCTPIKYDDILNLINLFVNKLN